MPKGGELLIQTDNVTLDENDAERHASLKPGLYARMSVSDSGLGMDADTKTRIFEPFFTTKPKGKGTGLGLAMVYGIVRQHGGNIEVYSEPGQGSRFNIYLPAVNEEPIELPKAKQIPPKLPTGTETILLVEDEPTVRVVASKVLKKLGYRVLEATNGGDAMIASQSHPEKIDLLLTDIVMPGMNGRELADTLQPQRPDMKVLFTSGYTEDYIVHHGVLKEGVHFIGKPYSPHALAVKVREVLES